jgi:predicted small secreted protein
MKKVAVTVAVLALGLAACQDNAADNNASAVNTVETEAEADVNNATTAADDALNAAGNAVDDAGNAVENAGDAVENAADNAN